MKGLILYATSSAPYHKEGEQILCSSNIADMLLSRGWARTEHTPIEVIKEKVEIQDKKNKNKKQ